MPDLNPMIPGSGGTMTIEQLVSAVASRLGVTTLEAARTAAAEVLTQYQVFATEALEVEVAERALAVATLTEKAAKIDSLRLLAYVKNNDYTGDSGISNIRRPLKAMVMDYIVPESGAVKLTGSVSYGAPSNTVTNLGLSIVDEAFTTVYTSVYSNRVPTNGGIAGIPPIEAILTGLTPGTQRSVVLAADAIGGGTGAYAVPFVLKAEGVLQ